VKTGFPLLVAVFLVLGVGGGAAFGGGVLYGRNSRTAKVTPPAAAGGAAALAAAGNAGAGAGGATTGGTPAAGGRGGLGGTAGAVDSLNGNVLMVRTQTGTTSTVNLTASTRILATLDATRDDLKPGTNVTVIGQADQSGTINATAVTITPSSINGGIAGTPGAAGQGTPGIRSGRSATPAAGATP